MFAFVRMILSGDSGQAIEACALQDAIITARDQLKLENDASTRRKILFLLTRQHPPHIQRFVEKLRANLGITPKQYALWEEERSQMIAETAGA